MITTVKRYSTSSFLAYSPLLRATQRCHLFEECSTICSILSRSSASSHKEPTPSAVLHTRYSILDAQRYLRHQCLPPRKHSIVTFETEVCRQWLPWQPGCNTDLSSFHGVESRTHGPILIILVTPLLKILLKLLPKFQVLIPIYK
jgi:hypothetical protein